MIKSISRDVFFLRQKADLVTKEDLQVGKDLQDTSKANREKCVECSSSHDD